MARASASVFVVAAASVLIVVSGIALAGGWLGPSPASADPAAAPSPAAPTPTPGGGAAGSGGVPPAGARPYLAPMAGDGPAIIHGIFTKYDWAQGVPDESNGKTVTGEFWIHLAAGGRADGFVGAYSIDGKVFQTIVQDANSMTVRFDQSLPGPGAAICRANSASTRAALDATLPQIVVPAELQPSGFVEQGAAHAPALVLPSTLPGSRVSSATAAEAWGSTVTQPASRVVTFDPASGRLLGWDSVSRDATGNVVAERHEAYGPIRSGSGSRSRPHRSGDCWRGPLQ